MTESALQEHARIEHKGRMFLIDEIEPGFWQVADESGLNYGVIRLESVVGEHDDPVYNGHTPGDDDPLLFGSSWDAIVRGLVNQYDGDHTAP